jgi:hypothetical protein
MKSGIEPVFLYEKIGISIEELGNREAKSFNSSCFLSHQDQDQIGIRNMELKPGKAEI